MTFQLPPELLSQHIAILGKTGAGKTFTAKGIVEMLLEDKRRVCVLDPTGVWYGLRSSSSGKLAGYPVAVFGGRHGDVAIAETSGAALAKIIASKNLPAVVDLSEMLIGARHRFMTDFAEALYRENSAPLHLVIDEADEFAPQNPLPETKRMLHHVDRIVRRGRVRGFRVMLITQRPAVLNKNVLTQANTLIAMRLTSPQDREALRAWVQGQADEKQAKDLLASLARLKTGEGWVWAPELDMLQRVTFPKIHTFDSSRTPENDETVVAPTKLASVDLGEIKASFAAVENEAKTVVELKAEVARLTKELARAGKELPKPLGIPDEEVLQKCKTAAANGYLQGEEMAIAEAKKALAAVALDVAAKIREHTETFIKSFAGRPTPSLKLAAPSFDRSTNTGVDEQGRTYSVAPPMPRSPARTAAPTANSGTSRPQQAILDVLWRLETMGIDQPTKIVVATLAGVSAKSSAFANNLGSLRSAGRIEYPSGGRVSLTDKGREMATGDRAAVTLAELHESFLRLVPRPQAAILTRLIEIYPKSISKGALADIVGASSASSAYSNNLGALRSLGAIAYPQSGHAVATSLLFPDGLK